VRDFLYLALLDHLAQFLGNLLFHRLQRLQRAGVDHILEADNPILRCDRFAHHKTSRSTGDIDHVWICGTLFHHLQKLAVLRREDIDPVLFSSNRTLQSGLGKLVLDRLDACGELLILSPAPERHALNTNLLCNFRLLVPAFCQQLSGLLSYWVS
jgi:hypothetical protein